MGVCEEEMQLEGSRRSERTWAREDKKSALLEAFAREQLMKTKQDGKDLAGVLVICELLWLAVAL
jgi:hypothetical protein